ncbi:MAG TPA: efflux RND transporter periplasmic adaptor subunit [Candidatus Paceibacterota bacterium]|nr:efflux RND transporter periplasmic adaptor subunit [Candidatus Paceibacterota bacterium]
MNYKQAFSNKLYWSFAIIVLIIAGFVYFGRGNGTNVETTKVERRTITEEVSATGNVTPIESVDLAFEINGRISSINAKVGDTVGAGQVIASLDSSELNTELDKAKADLASQQATLEKAQVDLNNYYGNIINTVNSAYTSANDAIRIKIDALFTDDETDNPKLVFDPFNSQDKIDAQNQRIAISGMLNSWITQINALGASTSQPDLETALSNAQNNLNATYDFLNLLMNATINSPSLSVSTLITYKTDINDARSEIDSASSAVTALMQNISLQKAVINSDQASIKSYQAGVDNINAQLSKTALRSPISGTVTRQDAKVGEIASANSVVASVISAGNYEIDSYIPEVDIARVKVGNSAKVTLDAYGNDVVFDAKVISIDPGETITEGVATYLTKFHFTKPDVRIRPGMTANIDIISASHDNVLSLPQRAIQKDGDNEFVTVYAPSTDKNVSSTQNVNIKTGLHGYDGYVEILSGLSEGQEIVMPALGI